VAGDTFDPGGPLWQDRRDETALIRAVRQTCTRSVLILAVWAAILASPAAAVVAEAQSLDLGVAATLRSLYESTPAARDLAPAAKGILVFPDIFRENYVFGVQSGNGSLLIGGKIVGYYTASSIAYGLQAGILPFASVLFLMTDSALSRLEQNGGWEVGRDPRVVVMPAGTTEQPDGNMDTQAGTMDATSGTMAPRITARPDTYAFVLGEAGLMTGVGRQGWKITKANP
jgi:lipid-binding SYLF domain-containing protein